MGNVGLIYCEYLMKGLIGFLGRLLLFYGIPTLAVIISAKLDIDGDAISSVIVASIVWMFIFHFVTKDWEDWGSD